jgi:hypothetical protein
MFREVVGFWKMMVLGVKLKKFMKHPFIEEKYESMIEFGSEIISFHKQNCLLKKLQHKE